MPKGKKAEAKHQYHPVIGATQLLTINILNMGFRCMLNHTGLLMMSANNCFWVMIGFGGNENTAKTKTTFKIGLKNGFIGLLRFFIARIGYESLN